MDISEAARTELSNLLHSLCEKIGVGDSHEELEREAERHFQAMRDSFKGMMKYGKNDVFVRYHRKKTPFAQMQEKGSVQGSPGASGYAQAI